MDHHIQTCTKALQWDTAKCTKALQRDKLHWKSWVNGKDNRWERQPTGKDNQQEIQPTWSTYKPCHRKSYYYAALNDAGTDLNQRESNQRERQPTGETTNVVFVEHVGWLIITMQEYVKINPGNAG